MTVVEIPKIYEAEHGCLEWRTNSQTFVNYSFLKNDKRNVHLHREIAAILYCRHVRAYVVLLGI